MHICNYRVGVDISTIHDCMLKFQSNIHQSNIITLHYTGNKFLQSGLEGNKYNNNIFKPCNPQTCSPLCNPVKY